MCLLLHVNFWLGFNCKLWTCGTGHGGCSGEDGELSPPPSSGFKSAKRCTNRQRAGFFLCSMMGTLPPPPKKTPYKTPYKTPIPFLSRAHLESDGLGPKAHCWWDVDGRERSAAAGGVRGERCFKWQKQFFSCKWILTFPGSRRGVNVDAFFVIPSEIPQVSPSVWNFCVPVFF